MEQGLTIIPCGNKKDRLNFAELARILGLRAVTLHALQLISLDENSSLSEKIYAHFYMENSNSASLLTALESMRMPLQDMLPGLEALVTANRSDPQVQLLEKIAVALIKYHLGQQQNACQAALDILRCKPPTVALLRECFSLFHSLPPIDPKQLPKDATALRAIKRQIEAYFTYRFELDLALGSLIVETGMQAAFHPNSFFGSILYVQLGSTAPHPGSTRMANIRADVSELVKRDTTDTLLFTRATCYEQLGMPKEAIEDYQAALKLNSSRASTHLRLGHIYHAQKKLKKAEEHFSAAQNFGAAEVEITRLKNETCECVAKADAKNAHRLRTFIPSFRSAAAAAALPPPPGFDL
jgi:tetratricopeptide (TPR) repeat protein